jgi:hypothetical protein
VFGKSLLEAGHKMFHNFRADGRLDSTISDQLVNGIHQGLAKTVQVACQLKLKLKW